MKKTDKHKAEKDKQTTEEGTQGVAEENQPDPSAAAVADSVEDTVAQLKAQIEELQNRELRVQAELENVRKRARREAQEQLKFAVLPVVRELIDVQDNLARALESGDGDSHSLRAGVKLVAEQLAQVLQDNGCQKIETVGQPFDPNFHESIRFVESDEFPANTIAEEVQTGYQIHGRVVRPAKVMVAAEKSEA